MNKKVEIIKKFASGDYGPGDKKEGMTNSEVQRTIAEEKLDEEYLKSL